MESVDQQQQQNDQIVSTNDLIDKKQDIDENALVEEVSLVEEEVKISAVIDSSAAAVVVEEKSSSIVETTSELQPLEKSSIDELSNLIDFDASKDVAIDDETLEKEGKNVVPPITPVATTTAVDVGETNNAAAAAAVDDNKTTDKQDVVTTSTKEEEKALDKQDEKNENAPLQEQSILKDQEKEIQEDKLNISDDMQVEDANVQQNQNDQDADTETTARNGNTDAVEDMDIDTDKPIDKKKKSAKQPTRKTNGRQAKSKAKPVKVQPIVQDDDEEEEEEEEEMPEYEVEKIVGHRTFKGKVVKYTVKWIGYPSSDNTTENAVTMHDDVPELCAAYWATCKEKRPDNVPYVAKEELKPIIQEQGQEIVDDDDDDEEYDPSESKKRSTAPQTTTRKPSSSSSSLSSNKVKAEEPSTLSSSPSKTNATNTEDSNTTSAPIDLPPVSKRKRTASTGVTESPSFKKFKKNMEHIPDYMVKLGYQFPVHWPNKKTEWDVDVKRVCVQASPIDSKVRFTYLEWNNGERTIHPMKEAHEMIPEKLIHYYEERLQFI